MEYSDFNRIEDSMLIGQVSELFSAPAIPKIVVVGLGSSVGGLGQAMEEENTATFLKTFRDILVRALDNLFVIEFCEQFIPTCTNKIFKVPFPGRQQINYRTHEVKESWMYKIRQECPSLLIDLRIIKEYEDDSILIEQIIETRNSLSLNGPIYLVWLIGNVSSNRLSNLIKNTKMDKTTLINIESSTDPQVITGSLKIRIKECFEQNKIFYKEVAKKYKKLVGEEPIKFLQPWMSTVYYYFKLGVIEEFRGDFQGALKYYHTILAKFKGIIEDGSGAKENRLLMINYLRRFSDICFIRLSFLLFRLNQGTEAEFGLFRYLNYFGNGLNYSDQSLWRYNLARTFARQLSLSFLWSSKEINSKIMRGPAHFLIFAISCAKNYLKSSIVDGASYQIQEMILNDLRDALEAASRNPNLGYFVDCLQILILNQYEVIDKVRILPNEAISYLNYLKEDSDNLFKWKGSLLTEILETSIESAKGQQNYQTAVIDTWRLLNLINNNNNNNNLKYHKQNFEIFQDWCLIHQQISNESIRLNFPILPNNFLFCNVKFMKETCQVLDFCEIELNIYNGGMFDFFPESIGIFFDIVDGDRDGDGDGYNKNTNINTIENQDNNENIVEPLTFICNDDENKFEIGKIVTFKGNFSPSLALTKLKTKIRNQIKISFVTMQLKNPFLALQFDEFCFSYRERELNNNNFYNNNSNNNTIYTNNTVHNNTKNYSREFSRICEKTSKKQLNLKIEPVKPKVLIEFDFNFEDLVVGIWHFVKLKITNLTKFPTITNFKFTTIKDCEIINLNCEEIKFLNIKFRYENLNRSKLKITATSKFNLQMIDFKYTEICSFEPIIEEFYSKEFKPIDPFEITLKPKIVKFKEEVKFEFTVKCFVEVSLFLSMKTTEEEANDNIKTISEFPINLKRGDSHVISFEYKDFDVNSLKNSSRDLILYGSFKLTGNREIYNHQWKFKFP